MPLQPSRLAYALLVQTGRTTRAGAFVALPSPSPPKQVHRFGARLWAALLAEFIGLAIFQIYGGRCGLRLGCPRSEHLLPEALTPGALTGQCE